jgi:hypothetical protein
MGFYTDRILPRLISAGMKNKAMKSAWVQD